MCLAADKRKAEKKTERQTRGERERQSEKEIERRRERGGEGEKYGRQTNTTSTHSGFQKTWLPSLLFAAGGEREGEANEVDWLVG